MGLANTIKMSQIDSGSVAFFINSGLQAGAFLPGAQQVFLPTGYVAVTSIANLRTINPTSLPDGSSAIVKSYYGIPAQNQGRGGGGMFIWEAGNTSTDDGGRYIAPNVSSSLGRWVRVINGPAYVSMWGAKGDGANDDSNAIQATFDACGYDFSEVNFSQGFYIVSRPLIMNACNTIKGDNPWTTIIQAAASYSGDILRTRQGDWAVSGNFYGFSGHNQADYFDHGVQFKDFGILMNSGASGVGITTFQIGEANYIQGVIITYGGIGIRAINNGVPGLRARNVRVIEQSIAGIQYEPAINGGANTRRVDGDTYLESISSDLRGSYRDTACVIKVISGMMSVNCQNFKIEGHPGGGIIQYQVADYEASNTPDGMVTYCGGTIICDSPSSNSKTSIVRFLPVSGVGASRSPVVNIYHVKVVGLDYMIEDYNLPYRTGIGGFGSGFHPTGAFRYYFDSAGSDAQAEGRTPIHYSACAAGGGDTNGDYLYTIRRKITQDGYSITKFTPTDTGWYRIASNIYFNHFGGQFSITDSTITGYTALSFDCLFRPYTGDIKIRYANTGSGAGIIGGWKNRISGIRGGYTSAGNGFLDIAIQQAFPTGDPSNDNFNPRNNFIQILHQPQGHEYIQGSTTVLTDPGFVTGFSGVNQFMVQKTLGSGLVGDIVF